ncbi:T-cell differentiation antigen CD6 [Camelus dromedarius]|uniref:T-cell differentiation antigen CD6 n=1 Tax=Camelus dromedarius TaxID=9838 RepID=A0A5N4DM52_CAMDR|nr:T-cell differentiation antigen CD6 [Camelus dromedarius]
MGVLLPESSVTVKMKDWESRELMLLITCIVLGILLLVSLISIAIILLRIKGKYALPATVNHQHLPTTTPVGIESYQGVPITIAKEEGRMSPTLGVGRAGEDRKGILAGGSVLLSVSGPHHPCSLPPVSAPFCPLPCHAPHSVLSPVPKLPIQVQALPPEDSNSSSDSDYEHYDFSTQPPVALTTFYNSQRYRFTDEEVQQNRFQMPPLEEEAPSLGPQHHPRNSSHSSTSSGEEYCNSPSSRLPPWDSQVFPSERNPLLEQPPNLELAGSQATFSGPPPDDSSSTSSGEWYQNFQPPPQPPSEQFGCPGSHNPQSNCSSSEDYDDIGAA